MAKGVYTVQEGNEHPKPDSSFYACTTALLIFLILIIIITVPLVYHKISDTSNLKRPPTEETSKNEKVAGHEKYAGKDETSSTTTMEKFNSTTSETISTAADETYNNETSSTTTMDKFNSTTSETNSTAADETYNNETSSTTTMDKFNSTTSETNSTAADETYNNETSSTTTMDKFNSTTSETNSTAADETYNNETSSTTMMDKFNSTTSETNSTAADETYNNETSSTTTMDKFNSTTSETNSTAADETYNNETSSTTTMDKFNSTTSETNSTAADETYNNETSSTTTMDKFNSTTSETNSTAADETYNNETSSTTTMDKFNSTTSETNSTAADETYNNETSSTTTMDKFNSTTSENITETSSQATTSLPSTGSTCEPGPNKETIQPGICETSECKVLASRMLSFMNHSTDPCADFYEYACGGLRSNEALLQYDPKKDVRRRIHDSMKKNANQSVYNQFAKFYNSCMSYDENMVMKDRVDQARAILDSVGKFHDNITWIDNITFTDLIYTLLTYHSSPLFDVLLDVDGKDPSRFSLKLVTPIYKSFFQKDMSLDEEECVKKLDLKQSQLDLTELYENYTNCRLTSHDKYLKTIKDALKEFGISRDDNAKDVIEVVRFINDTILSEVKKSLPSDGEMRRTYISKEYTVMTVSELNQTFKLVNWTNLFSRILNEQSISPNTTVQVYFKDFLTKLFNESNGIDQRTLHNALIAMFAHDLYADLVKMRNPCGRAEYCLQVASDLMTDLSSGLYLETFSEDDLFKKRTKVDSMFHNLKKNLRDQLQNSTWLDDTSKDQATKKLDNLTLVNDGGKHVFSNQFLKDRMNIEMDPGNYLKNSVELLKRYRRLMYSVYPMDPRQSNVTWTHFILPYSTESIAIYGTNMIVIPLGMLVEPLYHKTYPEYILTSGIGYVVAQAILHHFDTTGITYNTTGRRENAVLSSESAEKYANYASCVNTTLSENTTVVLPNGNSVVFKMNASLSNERMADQAAAKLALETYRASVNNTKLVLPWLNMNWQKLYFLSLAQTFCVKDTIVDDIIGLFENEHLPPPIRVNKLMEHSEEFSSANVFSCARGSNMNPEQKWNEFHPMTPPVYLCKPNDE